MHGSVIFLQVVGLTDDEERAAQAWDTGKLLELLAARLPLLITNLQRGCLLALPDLKTMVDAAIAKEGSSSGVVFTDLLLVTASKRFLRPAKVQLTLGARQIEQLAALLPLRLPFGRPFMLAGPHWRVLFETGRHNRVRIAGNTVTLQVRPGDAMELATLLHPRQGVYTLPSFPHLRWDVKQTTIRNAFGELVDIIG